MLDVTAPPLLDVAHVSQSFSKGSGEQGAPILKDVSLTLRSGEIVALLGRSGSGKSTLLRLISGLTRPTEGSVKLDGKPIDGPAEGVAMVFQSFALFPWLTVLDNVEIGPLAIGVSEIETRKRALKAIDTIGLDGFESAYPKELSGGMRQRVGFARALVVQPKILLMDEPFSALDVLTAETLRTDLLDLWHDKRLNIQSILMVTHNIEEAVLMSDRILVLASHPGRIAAEIANPLPHPRDRLDPEFRNMVEKIYALMTQRPEPKPLIPFGPSAGPNLGIALPRVSTNSIAGMIEEIAAPPYHGVADLPHLADSLQMEIDDLFPARRDAATAQTRGIRRRRHQAHAAGAAVRRHGRRPAQEGDGRATARQHSARRPHQARARRTPEPPRAGDSVSRGTGRLLVGGIRGTNFACDHYARALRRAVRL